nr:no exine formation [Tanacetum cinerariifolium]
MVCASVFVVFTHLPSASSTKLLPWVFALLVPLFPVTYGSVEGARTSLRGLYVAIFMLIALEIKFELTSLMQEKVNERGGLRHSQYGQSSNSNATIPPKMRFMKQRRVSTVPAFTIKRMVAEGAWMPALGNEDENFDPIPRTPKECEEESSDEEEQELRLSEEARIQQEEDADELYRNVNINQGRGLQVTQIVEDTHVTLTPVNPDGLQESSSMSSFVSSMLNPISDVGIKSIFTTTSSPIVSLKTPSPIMTPSTIATITTSGEAPIPTPTIPSIILENLLTFNSAFRFEERLRSLETSFSEYRQTNQFADAVSAILSIVHQYMDQQIKEAV